MGELSKKFGWVIQEFGWVDLFLFGWVGFWVSCPAPYNVYFYARNPSTLTTAFTIQFAHWFQLKLLLVGSRFIFIGFSRKINAILKKREREKGPDNRVCVLNSKIGFLKNGFERIKVVKLYVENRNWVIDKDDKFNYMYGAWNMYVFFFFNRRHSINLHYKM